MVCDKDVHDSAAAVVDLTAHPDDVKKPYLYFVDYGLPSNTPRGYLFDMDSLRVVDGPFTVAHGRGSSADKFGVPWMVVSQNATG